MMAVLCCFIKIIEFIWGLRGYFVFAAMIFLGLYYKRSKYVTALFCIYMWALIALNTYTADYDAYEEMYLCSFEPRYQQHEIGFMILCRIFLMMGLSYRQFRMMIALFIIVCVYKGIRYYTDCVNYVLALFLIFPFMEMASTLRNACSAAVILAVSRYLFGRRKYDSVKYIFGVAAAMLFHYSAVFYYIFLIARYSKLKNIVMMMQTLFFSICIFFVAKSDILYKFISKYTDREKTLQWLHFVPYVSPLYIISAGVFCVFLFILYNAKIIERNREKEGIHSCKKMDAEKMELIIRVLTISMTAFAAAICSSVVFLRLVMTMLPAGYAVCMNAFISYGSDDTATQRICMFLRVLLPVVLMIVSGAVFGYWIGGDVLHVFVNNLLFS